MRSDLKTAPVRQPRKRPPSALMLAYPVCSVDSRVLLPAGAALTRRVLMDMIARQGKPAGKSRLLLRHATLRRDLLDLVHSPSYEVIFSNSRKTAEVMAGLATVRTIDRVLDCFDYLARHDRYTYCHLLRVFALSALIAREMLPSDRDWLNFISMGPTHDIGKCCLPLSLLQKSVPITRAERRLIDHHAVAGYVLLSLFYGDPAHPAAIVARDHHERRDATGLPRGIRLASPMVETVIVCDIYDALITPRAYRPEPYDNRTALEEITRIAVARSIGWTPLRWLVAFNRSSLTDQKKVVVSTMQRGTPPAHNCYGRYED